MASDGAAPNSSKIAPCISKRWVNVQRLFGTSTRIKVLALDLATPNCSKIAPCLCIGWVTFKRLLTASTLIMVLAFDPWARTEWSSGDLGIGGVGMWMSLFLLAKEYADLCSAAC